MDVEAAAAAAGVDLATSKPMLVTQEELAAERVPLAYRDQCAHLLIPLNKCRVSEFYLPWRCEAERHAFEKCQYELVLERTLKMTRIREAQAAAASGKKVPLIPSTAKA